MTETLLWASISKILYHGYFIILVGSLFSLYYISDASNIRIRKIAQRKYSDADVWKNIKVKKKNIHKYKIK